MRAKAKSYFKGNKTFDKNQFPLQSKQHTDWTEQMEVDGNKHSAIKKTLGIYSIISNVNKGVLKDEISGLDDNKDYSEGEEQRVKDTSKIKIKFPYLFKCTFL